MRRRRHLSVSEQDGSHHATTGDPVTPLKYAGQEAPLEYAGQEAPLEYAGQEAPLEYAGQVGSAPR